MTLLELLLGVLGVWRVTHLFHAEDGPGDILIKFRRRLGNSIIGRAMDCFYCLSLWVALPFALVIAGTWRDRVLLWLAISGGAILLERATDRKPAAPIYSEDPPSGQEHDDVQLR
jgi:hypothetical protein